MESLPVDVDVTVWQAEASKWMWQRLGMGWDGMGWAGLGWAGMLEAATRCLSHFTSAQIILCAVYADT